MTQLMKFKNQQSPLWGLSNLHRNLDSVFEDFFSPSFNDGLTKEFSPACDVSESENAFTFTFEIPGMKKDDIKIEAKDNQLTVSGHREGTTENDDSKVHRIERFSGSFSRSFTLPGQTRSQDIEARYQDGLLEIVVPKSEEAKPRSIKVK